MTPEQRKKVLEAMDKLSEQEVDSVLQTMHTFTDFLYYACRDVYNIIKYTIQSVWNWIKKVFS